MYFGLIEENQSPFKGVVCNFSVFIHPRIIQFHLFTFFWIINDISDDLSLTRLFTESTLKI